MTRRLRVALVVPGWSPAGEPRALPALADLVSRLAEDHDLRLLTLRHPARAGAWRDGSGIAVRAMGGGTRGGASGRASVLAAAVLALRAWHRERPVDLVHGFWADEPGAAAVLAARSVGVPAVVSVMGGELVGLGDIGYGAALGWGGRATTALAMAGARLVTVGSAGLFRMVAERWPDVPLRQLPLGVDLDVFDPGPGTRPAARAGDAPALLLAGSLTPVKDPVLALRALARPALVGARLAVAGDGPLRSGLERLAATLGITERVAFLGVVRRTDLAGLLRASDALLVVSRHEAQSMVAREAAACGCPVVGTAVGVVPELGQAGGAVVVADRSAASLAGAAAALLGDPPRYASARSAARRWAERHADLARCAAGFVAAWREAVGDPR